LKLIQNQFAMRYSLIFFYFFVTVLLFSNVIIAQTTLDWVGAINGTDSNFGYDLDKDQNDNIYVCGAYVGSANFNLLTGSTLQTSNGSSDVFLAKYSKNGDLIWVKVFGGGINDAASRVKVGVNGAVYITGTFGGTVDFDPTSGTDNHTTVYREDVFVSKFDTAGNWIWTKTFGGNQNDKVNALETDSNGNIYLGGEFEETVDFNPGGATTSRTSTGGADGYILSLDSNGLYRWVSVVTGSQSSDEGIGGIKLNRSNELVVAEIIRGQLNYASVSKYNLSGALIWSKSFQNKSTQGGFVMIGDLEIDVNNNIIAVGQFYNEIDFDASNSELILEANNGVNGYVVKYNQSGGLVWVKNINTQNIPSVTFGITAPFKVKTDQKNNILIVGTYKGGTDLDPDTNNMVKIQSESGSEDILIASYNQNGEYIWHESFGGSDDERAVSCELLENNKIVSIGYFTGAVGFNPNDSTKDVLTTLGSGGYYDIFVQKLSYCPSTYKNLTVTGCNDYYAPNGKKYTTSGIYTDTILNTEGCDSIITIDVTISPLDTSVSRLGDRLISNANNAFYQWVDCNNNFAIINGADEQSFTPEKGGMYAVIVLKNNCQDTSSCFLSSVGLNELNFSKLVSVSPNPTDGISFISLPEKYSSVDVKVRNIHGQVILEEQYVNTQKIKVTLPNEMGVYFLELNTEDGNQSVIKVVKQ